MPTGREPAVAATSGPKPRAVMTNEAGVQTKAPVPVNDSTMHSGGRLKVAVFPTREEGTMNAVVAVLSQREVFCHWAAAAVLEILASTNVVVYVASADVVSPHRLRTILTADDSQWRKAISADCVASSVVRTLPDTPSEVVALRMLVTARREITTIMINEMMSTMPRWASPLRPRAGCFGILSLGMVGVVMNMGYKIL